MTDKQKAIAVSVLVLSTSICGIVCLTACQLYHTIVKLETRRLREIVHSHAVLIDEFTRISLDGTGSSLYLTLRMIRDAHVRGQSFGSTGELVVARQDGERIVFMTRHHSREDGLLPNPQANEAEPMRKALKGLTGTMIGTDYRGVRVLAAYEPLPRKGLGLVAKIDLAEIRVPFLRTMLLVGSATVLLIVLGIVVLLRFNPFLQRLEREKVKTQNYLDIAGTMLVVLDTDGRICQINLKGCEILGGTREELIGRRWIEECIHEHDRKAAAVVLEQLLVGQARQVDNRKEFQLSSGRIIEWSGRTVHEGNRTTGVISAGDDITERKQMEAALLQAKKEFQSTFEQAAVGIGHVALDGRWLRVNQKLCDILGYKSEELLRRKIQDVTHPDHLEISMAKAKELLLAHEAVTYSMEKQYVRKDGVDLWVNNTVSLVRDELGRPQYYISVVEDIQSRKEMEGSLLERTQQLVRSNKELDDFAYIASHDLKEPLRGIMSYSTFLLEDCGEQLGEEGKARLKTMEQLTKRLSDLTDDLLVFSRVGRLDLALRTVDFNKLVKDVLSVLQMSLEREQMHVRIAGPLPSLECDAVRMREVFHNLVTNALKYNDKQEKWLEIGALRQWNDPERPVFYVCDNGIGIPEKHLDKVFTMFKRLHGSGKFGGGTGAGLAIVKKIIERHEGRIWIESTAGEGSSFFFTIGRNLQ